MTLATNQLISGSGNCLTCNSTQLKHGPVITNGAEMSRSVECNQCGSSWKEQLSLTVSCATNLLDYAIGTVVYSLKAEIDQDENDVERTTPAGSEWVVEGLGMNGDRTANKSRSICCESTGGWILPEVSELKRDFPFLGDHRFLYFVHEDMEIRIPTISPCGRFSVNPAQYGFVRYSDNIMTLELPEKAGKLILTNVGDDFELVRLNASGVTLAREMVSKIKSVDEEDDAVEAAIVEIAPKASKRQTIIKCTDSLNNVSYLKQSPLGNWFAVLSSSIPCGISHCGILGDEVGFKIQMERTATPEQALALTQGRGARGYTYELV